MLTGIKTWLAILLSVAWLSVSSAQIVESDTSDTGSLSGSADALPYTQLDPGLLEAFIDGSIKTAMEDHHLPGVTVSVVQNGRLIFAKGYGLARTDPPQPVIADQTLFRIGSISKTFTFTAVMQLVEQGKLDLEADIAPVLGDIHIDDSLGPLTMVDLMTHSAGFEDAYFGFFYADSLERDLEHDNYFNQFAPHRVRSPGEQIVYSNFGVSLAGKIVELVSGETFADYTDNNIFEPLGMTRSSFRDYPNETAEGYLDPELEKDRAIGYNWSDGSYIPIDKFFLHRAQYPAGSVAATATDMAVFMLAHLNGGAIDGKRILKTATVEQMHSRLRGNAEGIQGNAHGFWGGQIRGYRTVEHGGAVLGFLSDMVLIPELGLGIFVSTNGSGGRGSVTALPRRIIENFYPPLVSPPKPDPAFSDQREVYSGKYLSNRRGYKIIDKLAAVDAVTVVSVSDEGYLITSSSQGSQRWLPLNDNQGDKQGVHIFENVDDGSRMAFEVGATGIAGRFFVAYGHNVADRVSFLQDPQFLNMTAGLVLILSIGCLFGFWLRRGSRLQQTGGEKLAAYGVGINSLLWLLFFAVVAMFIGEVSVPEPKILVRYPTPSAWAMHLTATGAAALAIANVAGLLPVWRAASWSVGRRFRHTVIVLAGLSLVWALNEWNVLGLRYLGA